MSISGLVMILNKYFWLLIILFKISTFILKCWLSFFKWPSFIYFPSQTEFTGSREFIFTELLLKWSQFKTSKKTKVETFLLYFQMLGRVGVEPVTSTKAYHGNKDLINLLLQILACKRMVSRFTWTISVANEPYYSLSTIFINISYNKSIHKNSVHEIQISKKLSHTQSSQVYTGKNTFSCSFVLPLGF